MPRSLFPRRNATRIHARARYEARRADTARTILAIRFTRILPKWRAYHLSEGAGLRRRRVSLMRQEATKMHRRAVALISAHAFRAPLYITTYRQAV